MNFARTLAGLAISCAPVVIGSPILAIYQQTNLVSDIPGMAANTDPNLKNPWGVSESSGSPFWVSNQVTGVATLYNSAGTPQPQPQPLIVSMPNMQKPTGQVFNGMAAAGAFNSDQFLFATLSGTIDGWRGALGTTAETVFTGTGSYTGLALSTISGNSYLYAANVATGNIDVYPSSGAPPLTGHFVDPSLPNGWKPYDVVVLAGFVYVTYFQPSSGAAPGNGIVDQFNLDGSFVARFATGGDLNEPWGLAIAPSTFGPAAGDLLVGNLGDGKINAFTLSGTEVGTLGNTSGTAIVNSGLWALQVGNGGNGGSSNSVYVSAGINNQADGLFAQIDAVPEPGTVGLVGLGLVALILPRLRNRARG